MGLDERYDEILQAEFSSEGVLVAGEDRVLDGAASLPGLGAAAKEAPMHGTPETPEVVEAEPERTERPRARARSRHAAMAGAGGMACAAVGALLGGLGGLGGPGGSGVL